MFRRRLANIIIVGFFSYAVYLIFTNGGQRTVTDFATMKTNLENKIRALYGKNPVKKANESVNNGSSGINMANNPVTPLPNPNNNKQS